MRHAFHLVNGLNDVKRGSRGRDTIPNRTQEAVATGSSPVSGCSPRPPAGFDCGPEPATRSERCHPAWLPLLVADVGGALKEPVRKAVGRLVDDAPQAVRTLAQLL